MGVVREWCQSLGVLTAVSLSRAEAEMKLGAYVPMLMRDFPDGAFTTDSLNAVARECTEGFPIYPVLAGRLSRWWREHRPYVALPAPPPPPPRPDPTPEEVAHVEQVTRAVVAWLRSSAQPVEDRRPPGARHLTPEQLDRLNPLPNGRKRTDATQATVSPADDATARADDTDTAASMAPADATADRA